MKKEIINIRELRSIARKMHSARLQEITLNYPTGSVRLRYDHAPLATPVTPPVITAPPALIPPELLSICSPIPGRLVLQHPDNSDPCANLSQPIKKNDLVALVQAGPLYLPVLSPADGLLESFMIDAGSIVEYGSEIARLKPVTL